MTRGRQSNQDLLAAAEREQSLLARRLHDTLCQSLTGTLLLVKVLQRRLEKGGSIQAAELIRVAGYLDESVNHVRAELSLPTRLSRKGGLTVLLQELAGETAKSIPCRFETIGKIAMGDPQAAFALYRIACEVIDTLRSSGTADGITVSLVRNKAGLTLGINAAGPASLRSKKTLPAFAVWSRYADAVGATLTSSQPTGGGVNLSCCLPAKRRTLRTKLRPHAGTSA